MPENPYNTFLDFFRNKSTPEQNPYDAMNNWMTQVGKDLLNFQSPFYQQFRSYMGSVTPSMGSDVLMSSMIGAGGGYGASQVSANEMTKNFERKRQDFLNQSVGGFASQNMQLFPQIMQLKHQALTTPRQMDIDRQRIEAEGGGMFDFLGAPFGSLFGDLFSGLFGGGGAGGAAAMTPIAASDIRFKENIIYTGEKIDGIPIVEFNYKNKSQRYRGVISEDVRKIKPEAVVNIDGYDYVHYDLLGIEMEKV